MKKITEKLSLKISIIFYVILFIDFVLALFVKNENLTVLLVLLLMPVCLVAITFTIIYIIKKVTNKKKTITKNVDSIIYLIITMFLGMFGVHKFIDKKIGLGILYLFTCGLFGIGWIIDIVKTIISLNDHKQNTFNVSFNGTTKNIEILEPTINNDTTKRDIVNDFTFTAPAKNATCNTSSNFSKPNNTHLNNYTVIDIETTGLNPNYCEIIEVAALKICNGNIISTFNSLIKPSHIISDEISNLTGIKQSELDNAALLTDVLPKYLDFISDDMIVGHNVNFDIRFINSSAKKLQLPQLNNDILDTLNLSRNVVPALKTHKLEYLIKYFNIDQSISHRALEDCKSTYHLLNCLLNHDNFSQLGIIKKTPNVNNFNFSLINPDNPLKNKKIVFKGTIKSCDEITLKKACELAGLKYNTSFQSWVNVMVMGEYTYYKYIGGNLSRYMEDAKEREEKGELQVISEYEFLEKITSK